MTANAKAKRTVVQLDDKLTVDEICADLGSPGRPLSRRTFYEWRMKGTGPACIKLPNGELRVTASEYQRWLDERKKAAA
jgi:predicted DNA-binding transcriptional regulator AlpA